MKSKVLLSSFVYSLIGLLLLFQANIVLAIASDPNNPITSAITSAISNDPTPTPQPTSAPTSEPTPTPAASQVPVSIPIIINPTPQPTPQASTPSATPIPTNNNTSHNLGVLVLKYFPLTSNGQNIDMNVTGDVGGSYATVRQHTSNVTSNLLSALHRATAYKGYQNSTASASLNYQIVGTKEYTQPVPMDITTRRPLYTQILNGENICNYVDNLGVREVWMWAYQGPTYPGSQYPYLNISESKMSSQFGDISNSYRGDDMPRCGHTYTLYVFNYSRGTAEALHSWSHQLEAELTAYDFTLFRNKFQNSCGTVHTPPNGTVDYDYANSISRNSDCLNWNPDTTNPVSAISCQAWGCQQIGDSNNPSLNYLVWMWQNLPGKGNTKSYKGAILRNLWDIHGDYDNVMGQKLTPVPAPTQAAVINTISPNFATQGTNITLTGANFTNSSRVYISGALMPTQFYTVSEDGTTLTFHLDTESTFRAGDTHGVAVANGKTLSNAVSLTIAPSVIQTIPNTTSNQIVVSPSVTLEANRPEVVFASSNFNTSINIPSSVTNPILNFSNALSTQQNQAIASYNNQINVVRTTPIGNIGLQIPALTQIAGPANWDGKISAPVVLANSTVIPVADNGTTATVQSVIEVGLGDTALTFDKAVRLLIPNQAGKLAAYQRGSAFTRIAQSCSADTQAAGDSLAAGGDCFISSGSDLVIWTKHFTKFVTYTQVSNNTSSGSGALQPPAPSYNTKAPVCTETKPTSAPKLLSAVVSGRNEVTLTWSKALDPVSYYLVAYGTKSGKMEYGNPNVGGKNTTSYVVKGLDNNKTYHFKVRAGNNCAPGEFSNEIAVKASGDKLVSNTAVGFKQGVLSTQVQKATPSSEEAKFKPITSANPQRVISESGTVFTRIINFFTSLFGRK